PTGPDDIEAVVARSGRLCDELEARAECRSEISKTLRALDVDWTTFLELLAEPGPTAGPLAARKGHSRSKAGLRAGGKPPRP
ncbi:MAG: hypothetical protein HYV07_21555, partial [Deltaproteobacteria bacterium]|nr:hypothetical protein [Deltaproteobacteria bacterium]